MLSEDDARDQYARFFVREHFLTSDYDRWRAGIRLEDIDRYLLTMSQKGYDWTWRDYIGVEYVKRSYWVNLTELEADEIRTDLPPTNSTKVSAADVVGVCRHEFAEGKKLAEADEYWRYLIAEATYHRLHHEALVRSYGVDVGAP